MENKILEIMKDWIIVPIRNGHPTGIEGSFDAAQNITSMVMEFIRWKDNLMSNGIIFYNGYDLYSYEDDDYILNELFQYWFDNIYKPTKDINYT